MTKQTTIRQQFDQHAAVYGRNPLTQWIGHSELAAMNQLIPPASP